VFTFENKPAQFNFNSFTERHGEAPKPAASASFKLNMEATALDMLHPALRPAFYYKQGRDAPTDLANEAHDAPNLRLPKLKLPLQWAVRWAGYQVRFHIGTSERAHVVLTDCQLDKIKLAPQEGGTVIVEFTAIFHPDEKTAGKLHMMNGQQFDVSLTAPDGVTEVQPKTNEAEAPGATPAETAAQQELVH
jgi:hypothetical protein